MQTGREKARVFAITAECFGGRGGIAQSTRDLMKAISNMREVKSIDILPRHQSEPITDLPSGITQFHASSSRFVFTARAIWLALKIRPQIVYCGHAFMAPLAFVVARITGAQLISHVHGLEVWQSLSKVKTGALAASDIILCVSKYTANKLIQITGIDSDRCKVIYNTFDDRFTPGNKLAAREKFNIAADETVISTVSRLDSRQRHKGHDRVIPLLRELAETHPSLVYLIAGTGDDRARLEALARDTDSENIVRFLGFVSDEDLPDLYRASDLYVMPSHGEGFGIAFVEAMACGTPALGLDQGGAGDALCNGELGRAVIESDFFEALRTSLVSTKPDCSDLSNRTYAAFGRLSFEDRLMKACATVLPSQKFH